MCLSFDANMPRSFWGEVVLSATYLMNQIPLNFLNFQTPFKHFTTISTYLTPQTLNHEFFVVLYLYIYMITNEENWIPIHTFLGYRCYHPPNHKVYTSMDVMFQEQDLYFSVAHEENRQSTTPQILDFPQDTTLLQNDRLLVESDR